MKRKHPIEHRKHGTYAPADSIHREDFETKEADAKKWASMHLEEIKKYLKPVETQSLEELNEPKEPGGINKLLRETGGDLDRLPIADDAGKEDPTLIERKLKYEDQQQHIKNALRYNSTKTPNRMFVYMPAEVSTISKKLEDFVDTKNPNLINLDVLKTFNYNYGLTSEFLAVTASYKKTYANEDENIRILFKVELPKGTPVLPAGGDSDTLYLKPGELVVYDPDELTVAIMGGKEYIWIDAKYVTPQNEGLDKKDEIATFQGKENIKWLKELEVSSQYELFQFDFSGLFAGAEVDFIAVAFNKLVSLDEKFKFSFLNNVTKYMIDDMGKVIITDRLLGYVPEMVLGYVNEKNIEAINKLNGKTIEATGNIGINIHNIQEGFEREDKIQYLLIRELSHIQDRRLGVAEYMGTTNLTSHNDANNGFFKDVYDREAGNLPEPFFGDLRPNTREYMAGIHALMYSNQIYKGESGVGLPNITGKTFSDIVKSRVPETVAWIKKYMYR
ncbi:hypothetical protein ABFE25_31070 [Bacillus toyonensis]|uniref:hypothetical protein n=1 Tax=Bacillus toyonensis TaxID=155322 RepID=UPI0032196D3C